MSGQVAILQPFVKKQQHMTFVPNGVFVASVLAWMDVPKEWTARVWRGLLLLFDYEYHGGRDHPRMCLHANLFVDVDERCPECRTTHQCSTCKQEFVLHVPCAGPVETAPIVPDEGPNRRRRSAIQTITFISPGRAA